MGAKFSKNIKLYGSSSLSNFSIFWRIPGFSKTIEPYLNFCLGYCITELVLLNHKKISP